MEFIWFDLVIAMAALFGLTAWLTLKQKLAAALSPLCALAAVSMVLTAAGMAGVLRPAALALYLLGFGLGGWALYSELHTPGGTPAARWCAVSARLFTPGAVAFWLLTVSFAVYFAVRQPLLNNFDEFSLWGTAAKITSTQNVIYTEGEIGWPWQGTQNCGMMMLSYFFQLFGQFAAWKTYVAYNTLLFACFGAVLCGLKWKDYALAFPLAAICWYAPYLFTVYGRTQYVWYVYTTSYGDIPAGIVFGGAVVFWLGLRQCGGPFWTLLPVLALCANIKSNTFVLSLAAAGLVAADLILFADAKPWHKGLAGRVGKALVAFVTPLATYLIWGRYTAALAAANAEAGGMGTTSESIISVAVNGVKMLLGLPVGEYYELRRGRFVQAAADMLNAFLSIRIAMIGPGVVVVVFLTGLCVLAALLARTGKEKLRTLVLWALIVICFAAYNFMLVLSYAFIFTEAQGTALIDYNRYLYSYYLGWFLTALTLLARQIPQSRLRLPGKAAVLALACACVFLYGRYVSWDTSVFGYDDSEFTQVQVNQQTVADAVEVITQDELRQGAVEQQRIFLVSQGDNGLRWFQLSYEFLPIVVDYSGWLRPENSTGVEYGAGGGTFGLPELYDGDVYYHAYTQDEFHRAVLESGAGYLFVETSNRIFEQSYAALFSDGLAAAAHGPAMYRVGDEGFELISGEGAA